MPIPCNRTYPLDPLTAEDPCEDCGRDERKHEIGPRQRRPCECSHDWLWGCGAPGCPAEK